MPRLLLLLAALSLVGRAAAQSPSPDVTVLLAPTDTTLTDAERSVRETITADGVHVVHFWAPWCDNSTNELARGWYEVVEQNADVGFTFVTIWNDGEVGAGTLDRYAIPERAARLVVPGARPARADRQLTFLGLPVSWIPTTWVFNRNGQLAYAFNFGELTMSQLQQALDGARSEWKHE